MTERLSGLEPYVPRIASGWDLEAPGSLWRPIDGTLVFVDISGFTSLSERLARRGRIGAEELTAVLNRVFGNMLEIVFERGGSLLKFGGDALLLLFNSEDHVLQACAATVEMRAALRQASRDKTSVGRIDLKMSSGIHTGMVDFFLVGKSHRELIVTGPAASMTTEMEATADAGEIVVSDAVRELVPTDFIGPSKGAGWVLRKHKINLLPIGQISRHVGEDPDLEIFVPTALRAHLVADIADSEHRIATVGFLEFQGVDGLLAAEGPERVADELNQLVSAVQDAADTENVTFLASDIDSDGGKVILATGVPTSLHDDEGRMLRAARRVLDSYQGLTVRVGVNRGHVFAGNVGTGFRRTFTIMGDTVNLAARLMAAAGSGELFSPPPVLNMSSTLFRTEPLEPFHVKGKEQPVQAFRVAEETGVRPPVLSAELPFTGREAELQMLVGVVNTCSRLGRGGMMTIVGETGVGKSRLIAEVLERCSGMDTVMVQAEPSGIDNPYWAFRDPLRRQLNIERATQTEMAVQLVQAISEQAPDLLWSLPLLGDVMHIEIEENEITAAIDPRFRPDRTVEALIELLSSGHTRPVALVIEDGQWLDEASLALLARIGEAARERPWTILVTARREDAFEPMGDTVALDPLDEEAMRSIAVRATAAAPLRPHELTAVVSKADGNPLFLGEILRVVAETGGVGELPDTLDAVISTEIDTLPPLPRQLLRYSSVLGRRFRRVVLDEFLEPEDVHLDAATEVELARFLEEEEDDEMRLAFRHNVVHEIAYGSLSYSKRRELHARAGDVIERQAGDNPEAVAEYLATHYSQSGSYAKAWQYSRIAGDKAKEAYANAEAAVQYRRALDSAKALEIAAEELASAQEKLGDVLDRLGSFDDALNAYRRAQHGYPHPAEKSRVMFVQAVMLQRMGELNRALGSLTRALKLASDSGSEGVVVDILSQRAAIRHIQGRNEQAVKLAEEALDHAAENPMTQGVALSSMIFDLATFYLGRPSDRSATWRAFQIGEELGDLHIQGGALNNLGLFAYYEGSWDQAAEFYGRGSDAFRRTGDEIAAAYGQANVAEILSEQGHLDEAESEFNESMTALRAAGDLRMLSFVITHLGRIAARRGDIGEALELFDEALDIYGGIGASAEVLEVTLRRIEALVYGGRVEDARWALENLSSDALTRLPPQLKPLAQRVRGLVAWIGGDHDRGVEELLEGVGAAQSLDSAVDELAAIHALASIGAASPGSADRAAELCQVLGVVSVPLLRVRKDQPMVT